MYDAVANLSKFVKISFSLNRPNKVDAAIARVISGKVDTTGQILHIGEVSSQTVPPDLIQIWQRTP